MLTRSSERIFNPSRYTGFIPETFKYPMHVFQQRVKKPSKNQKSKFIIACPGKHFGTIIN